ncbi:hypothetical protein DFP72DRAFT_935792 [Ephemerocybe angulata]|uniref:Uncharacterized protein n=1 Tax=Ephemerocybe angulata TaxID=980116 RepID=A0A8H6HBB0_9AGAR|nr:hypothetical protein DFP72DRAFT_935792 [Tulosesus angulatus]
MCYRGGDDRSVTSTERRLKYSYPCALCEAARPRNLSPRRFVFTSDHERISFWESCHIFLQSCEPVLREERLPFILSLVKKNLGDTFAADLSAHWKPQPKPATASLSRSTPPPTTATIPPPPQTEPMGTLFHRPVALMGDRSLKDELEFNEWGDRKTPMVPEHISTLHSGETWEEVETAPDCSQASPVSTATGPSTPQFISPSISSSTNLSSSSAPLLPLEKGPNHLKADVQVPFNFRFSIDILAILRVLFVIFVCSSSFFGVVMFFYFLLSPPGQSLFLLVFSS